MGEVVAVQKSRQCVPVCLGAAQTVDRPLMASRSYMNNPPVQRQDSDPTMLCAIEGEAWDGMHPLGVV